MPLDRREPLTNAPLYRRAAADQIAERLRGSILRGDIAPGEALRESELARAFHVTRNTVREALRVLAQNGLTSHEVHRGVTVKRFTVAQVNEVFAVRAIIQTAVGRRAGELSSEEIAALAEALDAAEAAVERKEFHNVLTQNMVFHKRMVRLLENSRLDNLFEQLFAEVTLMLVSLQPEVAGPWPSHNRMLLQLLVDGPRETFVLAMEHYLQTARDEIVERITNDESREL